MEPAITQTAGGIPQFTLNPENRRGPGVFEIWHEAGRPLAEIAPTGPISEFRGTLDGYGLNGVLLHKSTFTAATYTRTSRNGGGGDMLVLHVPLYGGERGVVKELPHFMAPDRICLQDWAWPYFSVAENTEKLALMIPRERIDARHWIRQRQPTVTWMASSPTGRLLRDSVVALWNSIPKLGAAPARVAAANLIDLLNEALFSVMRGRADEESAGACGMFPAMARYLNARLDDPELGVLDLCRDFRCSRATVCRLFQHVGGVRTYVRERRLAEIFRDLTRAEREFQTIGEVARGWGFLDPGHFDRLFKRRFGFTPGAAIAALAICPASCSTAHNCHL